MTKIPAKGNRYYIKKKFNGLGNTYHDGTIQQLTPEQAETFAGSVEHVAFPQLEKIELDLDQAVASYKQQRDQIRTSARYAENEPERFYQLQQLREKLDADVQNLRQKYDESVQLIQSDLAKRSTQLDVKPEAAQQAADMLSILGTQLAFSSTQGDVLSLFNQQIRAVGDDVKAALFVKFGSLLPAVQSDARDQLSAIYKQLEAAHPGMAAFKQKSAHLEALTRDHDPAMSYRHLSILEGWEGR